MEQIQSLKDFSGTEQYYSGYLGVSLTDGAYFVGVNGASWLITDICSILKVHSIVKKEEFVSINFKVENNKAEVIYTDGNEKILYTQNYKYTDFSKHFKESEIKFFYTDNVLMLSSEY